MKEQVCKYMAQNARIFCVTLSDAVERSAEMNGLSGDQKALLGKLEAFACCIAALQKVEKASVTARISLPLVGVFAATADRSGIVRGVWEDACDGKEASLEVTLQLFLRGTYTGVVTGTDFDDLTSGYFSRSLQIASACKIFSVEEGFVCIAAEKLPGEDCDLEDLCRRAGETLPFDAVPEDFTFLESSELKFGCTCSRGALLRLVSAMSPEERAELAENGKIVTHCNSCGKKDTVEG